MSDVCEIIRRETLPIIDCTELTPRERLEFDYLSDDELFDHDFVRYRGVVYDLNDTIRIEPPVAPHAQRPGWEEFDSYLSDSYFSGVLFRFINDGSVECATYIC